MLTRSVTPQRRHSLLATFAVLLVLAILTACGGSGGGATAPAGQSGGAQPGQPTAVPAAASSGNPVKIVWWHISTAEAAKQNWADMAAAYTKAHPNVQIEVNVLENEAFKSKLATAMQSGNPPDLFQTWGGGVLQQYAQAGLVQLAMRPQGGADAEHRRARMELLEEPDPLLGEGQAESLTWPCVREAAHRQAGGHQPALPDSGTAS